MVTIVEAALSTARVTPDWSGLSQYPPYNLPDPVINGGGTKTDVRAPVSDDSDASYVELSWAAGATPSYNRGPFTQGGDNLSEYLAGWPARPTTRQGFDGTINGDGYHSLSYAIAATYPRVGLAVEFGIRIAFSSSGPDPLTGYYYSPPAFHLGGIPGGFQEIPLTGAGASRFDGVFRDYVYTDSLDIAGPPGDLYLRPAAIDLGQDGPVEYRFSARISRMWMKIATPGIEGAIKSTRSRFTG